ncbi:MAG: DUF4091 domain-containing protein [Planctomycetia bacterium]|nr:DUF4091 domain-containing protein [Planctomycetia bacterium]
MIKRFCPLILGLFALVAVGLGGMTEKNVKAAENSASTEAVSMKTPVGVQKFDLSDPGWKLSEGKGKLLKSTDGVTGAVLEISGNGKMSNAWRLENVSVLPGRTAILRFKVRRTKGTGGAMTGLSCANFDVQVSTEWKTVSLVAMIPKSMEKVGLKLGQWMIDGTLQFAEVELLYAISTFSDNGLADDEIITEEDGIHTYHYASKLGGVQGNYSRAFLDAEGWFNTNRWCLGTKSFVLFRFDAANVAKYCANPEKPRFYGGELKFNVGYHVRGTLIAKTSTDGENWTTVAMQDAVGTASGKISLPKDGAESVWVRFEGGDATNLQLYSYRLDALLAPKNADAATKDEGNAPIGTQKAGVYGHTRFWELLNGDEITAENLPKDADLPKTLPGNQTFEKTILWTDADGKARSTDVRCTYYVADFYREDFGVSFVGPWEKDLTLWGCESTWKVTKTRSVPEKKAGSEAGNKTENGLKISAARNDYESCQLVLNPKRKLVLQDVKVSTLKNADGVEINAENVECRQVYYHFVEHPTDRTAVCDWYPDALPPATFPMTLNADENAPLWFTVYVPTGTPAGDYTAEITLSFKEEALTATLPLQVHVWDFDLPQRNHCATAYGFSHGTAARYHGVRGDENMRKLLDIYFTFLGKYRISPYTPMAMDGIQYEFVVDKENPEKSHAIVDFSRFDVAIERAIEKYGFTHFRLWVPGMGGGTFHARDEPSIKGFGEDTVEYHAMYSSALRQVESHLREKGWLDMAYVYWFDEPDVKDFEFVKNGMEKIKKYAPGIRTMLTEEPSTRVIEENQLGKIDIWCPVTPNFDAEIAEKCREKGEEFWWYVCCWPHAPYCTEFIDHSAVELRTWLWQSWKYDVTGTLIWASNYWTSDAAYPQEAQNPYEDPMSYVSGYSTPAGARLFWGNGDGRLYYPPLSCATPNKNFDAPNFEEPVPSIRFEMLREGIEDYEMLYLLSEKLKAAEISPEKRAEYEALLTVPEEITTSMTEFSTSPMPIYERREKVAEAIEKLK